jgi:thiol-disulfide isomerase/thioredoxin
MTTKMRIRAAIVLFAASILTAAAAQPGQTRQAPPEYKELVAASRLEDPAARLKEYERIKTAYPDTPYIEAIEASILEAKVTMAGSLEVVLGLQKEFIARGKGPARLQSPVAMAIQLLNHPGLAAFDAVKVLDAALGYRDEAVKAATDPATFEGVPQDQQDLFKSYFLNAVELISARAHLNAGDAAKAMAAVESYKRSGGPTGGNYHYVLAGIHEKTGKLSDAYEAYLSAAADNYEDASDRAKALYVKINGREEGFEAALAAKLKALPFHPEPFKAPADWKGKAVLAELFTGSECPPCVGADLAFDGLVESIPAKYLAVLVYHLPIPRPDPMMNPATEARQGAYSVNSTPTVLIDGIEKSVGGGNRGAAEGKYAQYRDSIEKLLASAPGVTLKARASLAGDTVKVTYDFDKAVPGVDYLLVLVQDEQEHKGGNGIAYHRMVVRDLLVADPDAPKSLAFDLADSEKAADDYLTAFEKSYTRIPNFKWEVRRHVLPRKGLKVVFFAQETATGKVLNAVLADVE